MSLATEPFEPRFTATAIGSLPLLDAEEAVDLVLSLMPEAPFWPQLPRADWREGMMVQYVEGLPGARLEPATKKVVLEIEAAALGMEDVAAAYEARRTDSVAISPEHSRGFHAFCRRLEAMPAASRPRLIKGHVTGPVTLALSLETDFEGRAAIYEPELARLVAQVVGLKARFQEEAFARAAPGLPTLIFFDEPSLGSIGSAVLNLDATLAVELLSIAARACQGLPGIHCCGETDLGLLVETGVKVINFDAHDHLESVAAAGRTLGQFLESGGLLALGIVPSSLPHPEAIEHETLEGLFARLLGVVDLLASRGVDRDLVARRSFLTPSCGTAGMRPALAEKSLRLTAELSRRARQAFWPGDGAG